MPVSSGSRHGELSCTRPLTKFREEMCPGCGAERERKLKASKQQQQQAASIKEMCQDDRPHQTWDIAMGLHSRLARPKYLIFRRLRRAIARVILCEALTEHRISNLLDGA